MNVQKTRLALLVALAVQQLASAAFAQTKSPDADLPEVKVKGSREVAPTDSPPTASSASKIEAPLRDQGANSMQDVMKMVPGIGLSHGDGQRDQVTIRGFSAISDQFIDGMRDDAMYFRDLSNTEQVEVIK